MYLLGAGLIWWKGGLLAVWVACGFWIPGADGFGDTCLGNASGLLVGGLVYAVGWSHLDFPGFSGFVGVGIIQILGFACAGLVCCWWFWFGVGCGPVVGWFGFGFCAFRAGLLDACVFGITVVVLQVRLFWIWFDFLVWVGRCGMFGWG